MPSNDIPSSASYDRDNSVQRMPDDILLNHAEQLLKQNMVPELFNIVPVSIIVFNEELQIIYTNQSFTDLIGIKPSFSSFGLRYGERLHCIRSYESKSGCGSAPYCKFCNGLRAVLESRKLKTIVKREFCFTYLDNQNRVQMAEFLVFAAPAVMLNENYTIFVMKDISEDKRKEWMERVFFHDLLNTSGAIKGLLKCAEETKDADQMAEILGDLKEISDIMIESVENQKDFIAAQNGRLKLNISGFSLTELLRKCVKHHQSTCPNINFTLDDNIMIYSDPLLIHRVLNNMLKNACESARRQPVSVSVNKLEKYVEVSVNNLCYIPEEVQDHIFDTSYSTKGKGHGLGTYSMKLFGEKYLKGYIRFQSEEESGTTFTFGIPYHFNDRL